MPDDLLFQKIKTPIQPGSMECESQIFDCIFDVTETRLITTGCDKTIKMFKQVDEDSQDSDSEKDESEKIYNNKNNNKFNLNESDDDDEDSEEN